MTFKNYLQSSLLTLVVALTGTVSPAPTSADFLIISRNSELVLDSTNLGGVEALLNSTDPMAPFAVQLMDSTTHEEPGGNINGGIWNGIHNSSVGVNLIQADLHSEVITQQLFGDGVPILDIRNEFEVDFEVTETTEILLSGDMFGTTDAPGADDFVRVRLQYFNGVVFFNMFSTSDLDDLNAPFQVTLEPNTTYRLLVESHADSMGIMQPVLAYLSAFDRKVPLEMSIRTVQSTCSTSVRLLTC